MRQKRRTLFLLALGAALALGACNAGAPSSGARSVCLTQAPVALDEATQGMVHVEAGAFSMGAAPMHEEEGPPRDVTVSGFWIDRTEVTNAAFAAFVEATHYVTSAERPLDPALYPGASPEDLRPSSLVFVGAQVDPNATNPAAWWRIVPGADWRHPEGPQSSIEGREHLPVVHVSYDDALAYAQWRGRDLPTEAEWEFAARGGLAGARYSWGDDAPEGRANYWQGLFPAVDTGADGYRAQAAPVGCYPANGYGLYDMAGNVWEWTRDWYRPGTSGAQHDDPLGPNADQAYDPADPATPKHVVKGGSFLCADNFCYRYRPPARQAGPPDSGSSHIGFRTVLRDRALQ